MSFIIVVFCAVSGCSFEKDEMFLQQGETLPNLTVGPGERPHRVLHLPDRGQ